MKTDRIVGNQKESTFKNDNERRRIVRIRSSRIRADNGFANTINKCAGLAMICAVILSVCLGVESQKAFVFWGVLLSGAMHSTILYCFSEIIMLLEEIRNIGLMEFVSNKNDGE